MSWKYIFSNWVYVVLSRVKTLNGLLLANKLNDNLTKYRISGDLKREMKGQIIQMNIDINWGKKRNGLVSLINKK